MKGIRLSVGVLVVLGLALLTANPTFAVAVGPDEVSFVTIRYDYPLPGYSAWYYTATFSVGEGVISHLALQLGECCNGTDAGLCEDCTTLIS